MDNAVPTDSVLRRHYEAQNKNPTQAKSSQNDSSGFMSWLKKLFGG